MVVQIMEGRCNDAEAMKRQGEKWDAELRPGAKGYLGVTAGVTDDGRSISIVRFESEEAARANSDRPEQGEWWAETEKLFDGTPALRSSPPWRTRRSSSWRGAPCGWHEVGAGVPDAATGRCRRPRPPDAAVVPDGRSRPRDRGRSRLVGRR